MAVLIVSYRCPEATVQAVRSLRDGTRSPERILVVDHSPSGDRPLSLGDGVEVERNPANPGFAAGVNRLVAAAPPGADLLLVNPDAVVGKRTVEHLEAFMAAHPRCAAATVPIDFDPPRETAWFTGGRLRLWLGDLRHVPTESGLTDFVTGAVLWIRRSAWDDVGPLDEGFFLYAEDADWCLRARARGWECRVSLAAPEDARARHAVSLAVGGREGSSPLRTFHIAFSSARLCRKHLPWRWLPFALPRLALLAIRVPHPWSWLRGLGRALRTPLDAPGPRVDQDRPRVD